MTWFPIFGAGFLVGWWVCAATWPRACYRDRRRSFEDKRQPSFAELLISFAELLIPPPRDRDPDWRRSFTHENTNRPQGDPPLRFQRSSTAASTRPSPTTPKPGIIPKPQFPPPRIIREDFLP